MFEEAVYEVGWFMVVIILWFRCTKFNRFVEVGEYFAQYFCYSWMMEIQARNNKVSNVSTLHTQTQQKPEGPVKIYRVPRPGEKIF